MIKINKKAIPIFEDNQNVDKVLGFVDNFLHVFEDYTSNCSLCLVLY